LKNVNRINGRDRVDGGDRANVGDRAGRHFTNYYFYDKVIPIYNSKDY